LGKVYFALSSVLALAGVAVGVWATHRPQERQLRVVGGRSAIGFFPSLLEGYGLRLYTKDTAEPDSTSGEVSHGFRIAQSDLRFRLQDGRLQRFDGGSIVHEGGFQLMGARKALNALSFRVTASKVVADGLDLTVTTGKETFVAFDLVNPRTSFFVEEKQLVVSAMDMMLTVRGAQELGRPDLAGKLLGMLTVFANSEPTDGKGDIEDPPGFETGPALDGLDVSLSAMSSLQSAGRVGAFPNGTNGLTMSTTSCNVGTVNIPWNAPMQVTHPVIAMNLYRVLNGRFEQVGWSWLKHGFFATNSNGCGTCQNPGTGSLLGVNCSDTYGPSNNSDRFYLGGRDELNAFTGVWTCTGSWFSNYVADCVRRNNGAGLDGAAHRLAVLDSDLGNSGATYYYEAFYILPNDINTYNQIGSRAATMSWGGTVWNFTTTDAMISGPAINRWGDLRNTAIPRTEGDVIVAVRTSDLGGGMWHYEYAVYNHNLDRQIREFSIPVPVGINIQSVGFHDIDQDAANQWPSTIANGAITWSTGIFGSPTANPLKYSSVFNFRFDANIPPAPTTSALTLFKPGTGAQLTASTKGPLVLQPVSGFQPVFAIVTGGDLQSLAASDDNRLGLVRGPAPTSNSAFGIKTTINGPASVVGSLTIGVESRDIVGPGSGGVRTIELWNWITQSWDLIDSRATTQPDSLVVVTVSTNVDRYIDATTREVQARILHNGGISPLSTRPIAFDLVGFQFN